MLKIGKLKTVATTDPVTTEPFQVPPQLAGACRFTPETIRLPKVRQLDPHFGLTRSFINALILPTAGNNFNPPVRSFVLRRRGARTGVRLVDFQSLKDYIRTHAEKSGVENQKQTTE